jgi:2'-5' RNA ligase
MRCFIAVEMSNDQVLACLMELGRVGAALRRVSPGNLHLTLKFLGEVKEELIPEISAAMEDALQGIEPFDAALKGLGTFPSLNYMRVVWVGIEKNRERLIEVQRSLDKRLAKLGFQRDKRFHPHLTLARVKSPKGKGELREFIVQHADTDFGAVRIERVELKKSVLTPKGPIYTTITTHEL